MKRKKPQGTEVNDSLDRTFTIIGYAIDSLEALGFLLYVSGVLDPETNPSLLIILIVGAVLLGLYKWMTADARKSYRQLQREPKATKPRTSGDIGEIAGLPKQPPWAG